MSAEKLTRSESDRIVAGVCGGMATYIGLDSVIVRLLFLVLSFASGMGLLLYAILWVVMPLENIEDSIRLEGEPELPAKTNKEIQATQMQTIGSVLLMFGGFFLLQQIGFFSWVSAGVFWPVVLIGIGAYLLYMRKKNEENVE